MQYIYDITGLFVIACQFGYIGDLECFDMAAEDNITYVYYLLEL